MKKITRRQLLKIAGMGAGASALAACTPAAAPTSAPAPAQEKPAAAAPTQAPAVAKPVELRITWWGSQDRHDRTIKVIDMYMKKNPNVKMVYEFMAFSDYLTKLTTLAAGNSLPDIMQQDYAWIAEWSKRGLILPLDDYVKSGLLNMSDVDEGMLKGGRIDNQLVAVNLGSNSQCFTFSQQALEKSGASLPSDTWTWDEFEKLASQAKEKTSMWGGSGLYGEQLWKSLYLSLGQWSYANDGTKLGYEDDKPFVEHLNRLLRMQKAGSIPSRAEDVASFTGKSVEQQPLPLGKAISDSHWSNQIVAVQKAIGADKPLKMAPLPRPSGGKSSNYIKPSQFFSITRDSGAKEEAAKFIDFFTNSIEANEILFAERGVPIATKVRESMEGKLGAAQKEMFGYVSRVAKIAEPIRPADPKGHSDIVKNIYNPQVIDAVMFEKISPEEGAALLRKEANAILAKNKSS
jgi:multiple sugar transport system substrate-binding protein